MKIFVLIPVALLALVAPFNRAFAQTWLWTNGAGALGWDAGTGVATDASGNILATGHFESPTLNFGGTILNNAGTESMFVAKYNPDGDILWANSVGENGAVVQATGISTDAAGNVLVTGFFTGATVTFGTTVLVGIGDYNMFIVKYDPNGNILWANGAGGNGLTVGSNVSTDAAGNVLVAVYSDSPTLTFGTTILSGAGDIDIFIVKYAPDGSVLWANHAGGTREDYGWDISSDAAGNILVTGYFGSPTLNFGSTTLNNANEGLGDMFIVKYAPNGSVLWANRTGGNATDFGYSISCDAAGNALIIGTFESSTLTFGSTTLSNTGVGFSDIFVAKYDPNGNVLWANRAGGAVNDFGYSISIDGLGNALVIGHFESSTLTFGTTVLSNSNAGSLDIFMAKYAPDGNVLWANRAGGVVSDYGFDISADASNNVIITGFFESPSITLGNTVLTNAGSSDIFVAKLSSGPTSIDEWATDNEQWTISPNPFTTQTTMQTDNPLHNTSLFVYNSLGQIVKEINNISEKTITLQRGNLPCGLYFARLVQDNRVIATKKLVVSD